MLEGAARVKMFEKIAFVRLIPAHLVRRHRADVETIDARRRYERLDQLRILRDRGDDESWTKLRSDIRLINLHDARERKQKLFHRERMVRFRQHHGWQQVRTVVPNSQAFAVTIRGGDVSRARLRQTGVDDRVDSLCNVGINEGGEHSVFIVSGAWVDLRESL